MQSARVTTPKSTTVKLANDDLTQALCQFRRTKANEHNVPPYVVLSNRSLAQIALEKPSTLADLGRVNGVGPKSLERYGHDILGIVSSKP